jgi:hypothetical protein
MLLSNTSWADANITSAMLKLRSLLFVACVASTDALVAQVRTNGPPPPPPSCGPIPGTLSYHGHSSGCTEASQTPCFAGENVRFDFRFVNPFIFNGSYAWLPEGGATPTFTTVPTLNHQYLSAGRFNARVVVFACYPNPTVVDQTVTVVNSAAVPATSNFSLILLAAGLFLAGIAVLR